MNKQDVFDRVVAHARAQPFRSINGDGCAYRGANGAKCFIGALITDDAYHAGLESQPASSYGVKKALERSGVHVTSRQEVAFCAALQMIHDDATSLDPVRNGVLVSWEEKFEMCARSFGVLYTPPPAWAPPA